MDFRSFTPIHVMTCISFLVSGLAINLVQFLLYLIIHPWNKQLFRTINYYCIYGIYCQLLFLADWWSSASLLLYAHPDVFESLGKTHSLILMNHHYELDWMYGWMVGDRFGLLGNCRVYSKKMLKYVPIIGWAWAMSDVVFLDRNWDKDKEVLKDKLKDLVEYPSPAWLLLFPEGTRFSPEKYQNSLEFSRKRGLPELQHHLCPRTKGFSFTVGQLDPERLEYVYDVTLVSGCEGTNPPTLTSALSGKTTQAHMYIRQFKLKDIPKDEEGSSQWLMKLFEEKDRLKDSFLKTGCFSAESGMPKFTPTSLPAKTNSLLVMLFVNLMVISPLLYIFYAGGFWTRFSLFVLFSLGWLMMHKLVNITKISKSSEYGLKKE